MISRTYAKVLAAFPGVRIVGGADIDPLRAREWGAELGLAAYPDIEALLDDAAVEIVLNLTTPDAHGPVSGLALQAAKHVYSEKPLSATFSEARSVMAVAHRRGLVVGCAPDTFLGAGLQTCRELIDRGAIGTPLAATAHFMGHGMEHWHPDPAFFYRKGGGPVLDMGPYYLTALVHLLGPVTKVNALGAKGFSRRLVSIGPKTGEYVSVETPTHVLGLLQMANGAIVDTSMSFDVWGTEMPRLEIYGTEGTLSLPDPNTFGGPVRIMKGRGDWEEVAVDRPFGDQSRGIGLVDMSHALGSGRSPRASGELALHVLEALEGLLVSSETGEWTVMTTTVERPESLVPGELEVRV
jgi:predicted dehydrogenase